MASLRIAIVGAGLAGSLLGNGLLNSGLDLTVFESEPQDSSREGYQIRLGSPALAGFKQCLEPDRQASLIAKFGRSGGVLSSAPILYDTQLRVILDLTKFPAYTKSAPINRVVLRDFLREKLDAASKVKYGKRFVKYEVLKAPGSPGSIRLFFQDGTTFICDVLIAAEGNRSKVNSQVGLNNIVQLSDKWRFLAKGHLSNARLKELPPEVKRGPISVVKDGVILFFSVYMPAPKPSAVKGIEYEDEYDEEAASLFWSLSVPSENVPIGGPSATDKLAFCLEQLKDWHPKFQAMLRMTGEGYIHAFQARSSEQPPKHWRASLRKGGAPEKVGNPHVWLIGDAVHPMLPARGMGGNQALRDTADALPILVRLAAKGEQGSLSESDFEDAVLEYEECMLPRAFGWVKKSGGTSGELIEPESVKGKVMLFLASGVLHVVHLLSLIGSALGYKPKDDAPELPN
ncbi:hypothetical protein BJY01DRAFT_254921 [Aspergillus pseudoustus]|uniref:FAD-binding domain-containing protein n=1 Tax=Aspergillus pseudoustus TaxID=1810923 RepID=A0ABR4IS59_9EURO